MMTESGFVPDVLDTKIYDEIITVENDGACRVEVFELGEELSLELFSLFDVGQFEKRGLADQLVRRSVNLAHNVSS